MRNDAMGWCNVDGARRQTLKGVERHGEANLDAKVTGGELQQKKTNDNGGDDSVSGRVLCECVVSARAKFECECVVSE